MTNLINQGRPERIFGIDFIRSVCAILLIFFHYACHTSSIYKFFYSTKTSNWGFIVVTVFFALSGASLFVNYPEVKNLKRFYYNRWKSIFPMYYICFLFFFMQNVFRMHKLFYGPRPVTLLYTVFGLDGYLLYRYNNYYNVGEWFLGAIIILYFLYPFILRTMKKSRLILPVFLTIGNIIVVCSDYFLIEQTRNLITCLTSFYFGMIGAKYTDVIQNKITLAVSCLLFFLLTFFPFHMIHGRSFLFFQLLQSYAFLIILLHAGEWIKKTDASVLFCKLSRLSYPIFLLQHKIILNVLGVWDPHSWVKEIVIITITIIITIISAKTLSVTTNAMLTSRAYKTFEEKLYPGSSAKKIG